MDRMELAKRRKEEVVKMLQSMNIKTDEAGGFVKEDVYASLQDLCNLYEANIAKLEMAYDSEWKSVQQQVLAERAAVEQRVAEAKAEAEKEAAAQTQEIQQKLQKYE